MQDDGHQTGGAPARAKPRRRMGRRKVEGPTSFLGATLEERMRLRTVVDPETGCHLWTGTLTPGGYGRVHVAAHRLAWQLANGPIPAGMLVLHRCDNPRCCNPEHLFLGTAQDNMTDKVRKGRTRNGWTGKLTAPRKAAGQDGASSSRPYTIAHPARRRTMRPFILSMLREAAAPLTSAQITDAWLAKGEVGPNETRVVISRRVGSMLTHLRNQGAARHEGIGADGYNGWVSA
ncbi:MAG: HNH endonuclease signature motif containing protein [Caulobacteraceae bacterium]